MRVLLAVSSNFPDNPRTNVFYGMIIFNEVVKYEVLVFASSIVSDFKRMAAEEQL